MIMLTNILSIAERFKTPLYIYDAEKISGAYKSLKLALSKHIDIFYSLKANPNLTISSELKEMGAGAEVCSYYEIEAAIKVGFMPRNIIFVGPAKTECDIKKCVTTGIFAIIRESLNELKMISDVAMKENAVARVALRINPLHTSKTALLQMGGKPAQFGMDEEVVFANKDYFLCMPNIKIVGVHVYHGTRILDVPTVIENTKYIFSLAEKLQNEWNVPFEMVDIGGGIGVPYFDNENEFDLHELKILITPIVGEYVRKNRDVRIILESGRFLVGKSGVMASRIIDIKSSRGECFVITDGGINCHMAAVGIGSIVKRNFPIFLIKKDTQVKMDVFPTELKKYNITGPLCTRGICLVSKLCFQMCK